MNNDNEIVKLKYDVVFKMFFCNKDNESLLKSLLSRILNVPYDKIESIEIVNGELLPEEDDEKFGRIDINLIVDSRKINLEMQFNREGNFKERTLYYWSKLYSGALKSGEPYGKLPECVCVNIINFSLFDCADYHSHFKVMETQRHELLTNRLDIHFFELPKLGDKLDENDPLKLWMQLINAETREELTMLEQTNVREIQDAAMVIRKMSADERAKEVSRRREKRLHDEADALSFAREEGKTEGIAEGVEMGKAIGIEKGKAEMAEYLRKLGVPEETIQAAMKNC